MGSPRMQKETTCKTLLKVWLKQSCCFRILILAFSTVTAHWIPNHHRMPALNRWWTTFWNTEPRSWCSIWLGLGLKKRDPPWSTEGIFWSGLPGRDPKEKKSLRSHQKTAKRKGFRQSFGCFLTVALFIIWQNLTKRGLAPAAIIKEVPSAASPMEMLEKLSWETVDAKRQNTDRERERESTEKTHRISPRHSGHNLHAEVNIRSGKQRLAIPAVRLANTEL